MDDPPADLLVQSLARGWGSPPRWLRSWYAAAWSRRRPPAAFSGRPLDELADPNSLAGMTEAVETIRLAVRSGTGILVHGDYDVDGQCAAALLTRALRLAGAVVTPLPSPIGFATVTTSAPPASRRPEPPVPA